MGVGCGAAARSTAIASATLQRATADRDWFVEHSAERRMAELGPQAEAVVEDMRAAAQSLLDADAAWFALQARVSALLTVQHRQPRDAAPASMS